MPLVVPGITSNSGDKTEEWTNKLIGKKISEEPSNEIVCHPLPLSVLPLVGVVLISSSSRTSARPIYRKKPGSSSPARWLPRTIIPRGSTSMSRRMEPSAMFIMVEDCLCRGQTCGVGRGL